VSERPLERHIVREAARWYIRLNGAEHSPALQLRFERWRDQHPDHARAWQLAQRVSEQWQGVPEGVALPTLERADGLSRRAGLKALMVLMTAAPAALVAWRQTDWLADERTAIGEQRELTLIDGTRLALNTQTGVDIVFDASQRLLRLRGGEILVITHPDSLSRPLSVQTEQGIIRALGTRFSVRQEGNDSQVSVFAGAVAIQPVQGGSDLHLSAGQSAHFDRRQVSSPAPLLTGAGEWASGVLRVERMPLNLFVEELNRYRPGWVRCDAQVGQLLISGAFLLRDTDLILSAVSRALPVQVVYRTRYWVSLQARTV